MYELFEMLPEDQKTYYNFVHIEALRMCRDMLCIDYGSNKTVSAMRHLTKDEKRRLLETCAQCIYIS
ncbi:hypothetical protein DL764_008643 [Monosporascus ibericus]|uniref:Uncharacterized protein n=1 Tax=Monosporascus ibericus TaxID=155417 RepID=A0A4Q4SX02_9PEZI|nr:hypothetical protein DL764_008643 [Monosporascus ibericus]